MLRALVFALALLSAPALAETPEQRLAKAGLALPPPNAPIGLYVPAARSGKLLFLAGHTECPIKATGKLGATMDVAAGKANAASVALCMLATLKAELGELSRVKRVVRVMGLVNSTADFTDHPAVMNGFSEVMVTAFGDAGKAPRTAAGAASLPRGIPVEVEAIVELR